MIAESRVCVFLEGFPGLGGGATGGAVMGGAKAYNADEARHAIVDDLQQKSLQTKSI
jgi:hypothetical protein